MNDDHSRKGEQNPASTCSRRLWGPRAPSLFNKTADPLTLTIQQNIIELKKTQDIMYIVIRNAFENLNKYEENSQKWLKHFEDLQNFFKISKNITKIVSASIVNCECCSVNFDSTNYVGINKHFR
jgi:hypothetical protein